MSRNNHPIDQIFSRSETPTQAQLLAYAKGELDAAEARMVEKALVDDPFLADALEGIEEAGTDVFAEMMADLDQALDQRLSGSEDSEEEGGTEIDFTQAVETAPKKNKSYFRIISIAASITLIAMVGVFLFLSPGYDLKDYYQAPPTPVNRGVQGPSEYERAGILFEEGRYKEACKIYENLAGSSPKLMAGHSYFNMGEYSLAADCFRSVISFNDINKQDAEYNLALALLEEDQNEEGENMLKRIAKNDRHIFKQKARELLKKLD